MPRFSGYGSGRGKWTKRRYLPDGTVLEGDAPAPAPKKGPVHHTRFKPFTSYQVAPEDAAALGLKRTKIKGTVFETERQLNDYLAREKSLGRDTGWKDF